MAAVIEVKDLCFSRGGQEVLHNVSFAIQPHALVAVVGPNGGGKTTLLRLLLGELRPQYGSVRVFNESPDRVRDRIGYVPQTLPFDNRFPISVGEVVLMGRIAHTRLGFYRKTDHDVMREALCRVDLDGFEKRSFAALSGGERQRVLIAQALAGGSELLLLDEPTANVDPKHATLLYDLFSRLTRSMTVMMVSHNLGVVTGHATHVLCLNRSAGLHAIGEVASATFTEAFGGELRTIRHAADCTVTDPSHNLGTPHHAACCHEGHSIPQTESISHSTGYSKE